MCDERLTDALAGLLGMRKAPGRYLKPGRSWIPESRFRPLSDVRDALSVLDSLAADYVLKRTGTGSFLAEICIAGRVGKSMGDAKARTICLAIAGALGWDLGSSVPYTSGTIPCGTGVHRGR